MDIDNLKALIEDCDDEQEREEYRAQLRELRKNSVRRPEAVARLTATQTKRVCAGSSPISFLKDYKTKKY